MVLQFCDCFNKNVMIDYENVNRNKNDQCFRYCFVKQSELKKTFLFRTMTSADLSTGNYKLAEKVFYDITAK